MTTNALQYYTTSTTSSMIQLVLVSSWESFDHAVSIRHRLLEQQFNLKNGDVAYIGEEGRLTTVYIGQEDTDVSAIAHAILKLPEGTYEVHKKLSEAACALWSTAQYRFNCFKKKPNICRKLYLDAILLAKIVPQVSSIFLGRDLINMPANIMHPEALVGALKSLATVHDAVYTEYVGAALLEAGFPAIYAVGRAADVAPRLGCLTYGPSTAPHVVLVGKGVCFDSGGLDIKPSSGMRLMKKDMGGAAIAIAAASWILTSKLPIRLAVLIPAVENAIGAGAYRPGDILTMRSGLTVEIENTDAEGRLILADALTYASELQPDLIIDFSTLTGAARVALGTDISAFFTHDTSLSADWMTASHITQDWVWPLPLHRGYASLNDSSVADLANATHSSYAGAITAALFLEKFVSPSVTWVHVDTMAWQLSSKPGQPEGGEVMSLKTVLQYLTQRYGKA